MKLPSRLSVLVPAVLALSACSSLRSHIKPGVSTSPVRVLELSSEELGQGSFEGVAPPQSPIAPLFLDGDTVLAVTMGGAIELRDVRSMNVRWRLPIEIGVSAQPLVIGSSVVVAGMDAVVRKIRLSNGQIEWSAKIPAESPGGVAAAQGIVFVTAGDDSLTALDEKSGGALWSYKRPLRESNILWSLKGSATPALSPDGRILYAGFSDGAFVALEASSGKTLWERNFDRAGRFKDVDTSPVLSPDGGLIYLSVVDGDLVALRARDGSTLWSLPGAAATSPLVDTKEKVLYLSTRDNKVLKVSLEDNRTLWTADLGAKRGMGSKPVLVGDGFVAVTTTRAGVAVLSRDSGQLLWESNYAIGTLAAPSVDGKRMAVLSARNRLHLYSVEKRL